MPLIIIILYGLIIISIQCWNAIIKYNPRFRKFIYKIRQKYWDMRVDRPHNKREYYDYQLYLMRKKYGNKEAYKRWTRANIGKMQDCHKVSTMEFIWDRSIKRFGK